MFRFLLLVLFLGEALSADHDTFKNCSRVEFCNKFRSATFENKYTVDNTSVAVDEEKSQFFLKLLPNDDSKTLELTLTALDDNMFRIQLQETDSSRYQLQDVLDGEPKIANQSSFSVSYEADSIIVENLPYTKAKIYNSPFNVEFYFLDNLVQVFQGDRVNFDESLDQAYSFGVGFPQAVQLYGIHEHAEDINLQTTSPNGTDPYRLRNLDVSDYELNSPMALYGSVPVIYGHGPNSTTGVFLHNAAEQWYEINNGEDSNAYIMVESGSLDLFVLLGSQPSWVVREYNTLTGRAPLLQLWALGYHQCRWSYMSQNEVKDVVANFTNTNFPLDVIWLDVDYTDGKRYFTWNPENFTDPLELQQNVSAAHKRMVTIIDPHIKVEEGYVVYDGALENNYFVNNSDGTVFQGDCWPGLSSYMDFLNPDARDYYGSYYSYENFPSSTPVIAGIWNDMNEPSVFDTSIEKTIPGDALHFGGVRHRDIHNIYGLLHTRSTYEGLLKRDNNTKRPFVLTRAHFAGTQRYSSIWTGDNTADWGYLSISYSQCANAGLLGHVFCGADVGGFSGNPTEELFQRWYQAGAWLPFYRGHSSQGTNRREPYLFSEEIQEVVRNSIQLRYKHIPMWYTLFFQHTKYGNPVVAPLFYHYPADENTYKLKDQIIVGYDVLVRAVAEPEVESVPVYFPGGVEEYWFSIDDNKEVYQGTGFFNVSVDINTIPKYYKGGSVIVRKDIERLSTDEMKDDSYTIYVNLNANNMAIGYVYLDDFTSFDYIDNKFSYIGISAFHTNVHMAIHDGDGSFDFLFDEIIINRVTKEPSKDSPGLYQSVKYRKNKDGHLLNELTLNLKEGYTIQLED